jgi:hypothetical protein
MSRKFTALSRLKLKSRAGRDVDRALHSLLAAAESIEASQLATAFLHEMRESLSTALGMAEIIERETDVISKGLYLEKLSAFLSEISRLGHHAQKLQIFTNDMVTELSGKLQAEAPETSSTTASSGDHHAMSLAAVGIEIDSLYDQIRSLVQSVADARGRGEAMRPLRARLEELEEIEADLLEEHSRAQMRFDPDRALRVEARMREFLDRT